MRNLYILFIALNLFQVSFSQKKELKNKLDFLTINKPKSIDVIDSVFINYRKHKEGLDKLLKESKKINYLEGIYYAKNALGRYYRDLSLFDKSINEYKDALEITRNLNLIERELKILNSIGSVYRRQDEVINGLNYHKEALDKALSIEKPSLSVKKSISISQNSIGNIYISLKQYNLALEEFSEAIVIQKELDHKLGLAINYQNMGKAHEELGNLDKALSNYYKSLSYNNKIDSNVGRIICAYSIALVLIKKGQYIKANETVNNVLPLAIKENDKYYLSNTYNTLGLTNIYVKQYKEAESNLKNALDIATKYNVQTIIVRANENLAILYEKLNNFEKAYFHHKQAKEESFKTFNARNLIYVRDLITEYKREKAANEIKELAKKNEIAQLQINRIRNLWILALCIIILIVIVFYFLIRQKTLQNEKKVLSLKQEALRSQMNPHFLFNALNSIKLYIINNNQKKATFYLNKFSKLMRKILEASSLQEISLAEEIKTMKLYMSIENIRFSNSIDFKIFASDDLNLETIKIPPLILQPFLENSIWHGLSSKKEDKKVRIDIKKSSYNFIEISITDNGIGRAASTKIKANKTINKKSVGIDLTTERLKTFVKNLENSFLLVYEDLKGKNNESLGTKVTLKIPLS